jgi:hypothetical protein
MSKTTRKLKAAGAVSSTRLVRQAFMHGYNIGVSHGLHYAQPDPQEVPDAAKEWEKCKAQILPNSMFGPKSPAERAAPRDSVISWANYEAVGGFCQYVNFG